MKRHARSTNFRLEPNYTPEKFLNRLLEISKLKYDADLIPILGVKSSTISRIRSKKINITAQIVLKVHLELNLSLKEIRELLGVKDAKF